MENKPTQEQVKSYVDNLPEEWIKVVIENEPTMENKQPKSLNESILIIFARNSYWNEYADAYIINHDKTANAIERLVLQEKIDLLTELNDEDYKNEVCVPTLERKITELHNQLNNINQ